MYAYINIEAVIKFSSISMQLNWLKKIMILLEFLHVLTYRTVNVII